MILEIEVGQCSVALVSGFGDFFKKSSQALKDGFQPGDDLPSIATSAFSDLLPSLMNIAEVKIELDQNPDSRAIIAALLLNEIMDALD